MQQENLQTTGQNPGNSAKEVVLVTGSSGLIGSALIKKLANKYRMAGLDRPGAPHPPEEALAIPFDLTDEKSIRTALAEVKENFGNKIVSVVHLAAYYDFSGKPSPLYEEVTEKGTERLLKALQPFEVGQFVFTSTNLIYKPSKPGVKIHEDCPVDPNWDYPESKVHTEKIIHEKRGAIPAVLLRVAGVYDDYGHSIPITHQIQRIYERQFTSHFYSGDITHGNVFVHLDDLLDAMEKTIEKRKELPEEIAINIGEPTTPSYEELQEDIANLVHGEEWKTFEMPEPVAKAGAYVMDLFGDPFIKPWMIDRADDHYELDISRARNMLGWEPKHNLRETLPKMAAALTADPEKWYEVNGLNA